MKAVRYALPVMIIISGILLAVLQRDKAALEAGALLISAGASVYLLNLLFRIGVKGDQERDREEAARQYYEKHGHWPES